MAEKPTPKSLRSAAGHTVEYVAQRLRIHKSNYSRKENGKTRFTLSEATCLANLYGLKVDDISFPAKTVVEHATTNGSGDHKPDTFAQ